MKEKDWLTLKIYLEIFFKIVFFIVVCAGLFCVGYMCINHKDKYDDGMVPIVNADKLFIKLKHEVFTQAFNDNDVLEVDGTVSKDVFRFRAKDAGLFNDLMLGNDSLAKKTESMFNGFKYVEDSTGTYFYMPLERSEKSGFDYVSVPTWLLSSLIDEEILSIDSTVITSNNKMHWGCNRNKE